MAALRNHRQVAGTWPPAATHPRDPSILNDPDHPDYPRTSVPGPIHPADLTAVAMRFFTAVLALLPLALALDKPIDIEVTHKVDCDRKTVSGDKVDVHYRGTLEADGTGASQSQSQLQSRSELPTLSPPG